MTASTIGIPVNQAYKETFSGPSSDDQESKVTAPETTILIRAFNEDKPYDVFLKEQIAGDELDHVTRDSLIATGFLRCHAKVGFREKDNPQYRFDYLDDMIATGSTIVKVLPSPPSLLTSTRPPCASTT